jgi:hypothetical protein
MPTLKRASKSRPSGQWSDADYDVFDGEQHIGRIILHLQAKDLTPMTQSDPQNPSFPS